jgi:hypothetical protein
MFEGGECKIHQIGVYNDLENRAASDAFELENAKHSNKETYGNQQNRRAAYMNVKHDENTFLGIFTNIWDSDMEIEDCNGVPLFTAERNHRLYAANAGKDSYIRTESGDTENVMLIQDRSTPVKDLIRVSYEEPCSPLFPPFCQKMGKNRQILHPSSFYNNEFEGRIIQPEYTQNTGANNLIELKYRDGGATDLRFITLYSAYQFSNTRWSPLMTIIFAVLDFICFCVCCQCCCVKLPSREERREEFKEDQEKLLSTIEIDPMMSTEVPAVQKRGHFLGTTNLNCCSRQASNTQQQRTFWSSGTKIYDDAKTKIKDSTKK